MSQLGTPDGQRGVVSAQKLVATVNSGVASVTVGIPANAESLILLSGGFQAGIVPTNAGTTTGASYPVSVYNSISSSSVYTAFVISVSQAADAQLSISFTGAPTSTWYVVADQGVRQVVDMALQLITAIPGRVAPYSGAIVGGTDGLDYRQFLTDTTGRLETLPGNDGTNQHALQTDTNGRVVPLVPTDSVSVTATSAPLIAAPGSGALYLFGADCDPNTNCVWTIVRHSDSRILATLGAAFRTYNGTNYAAVDDHTDLNGLRVAGQVDATLFNSGGRLTLRYATGP